MNSQLISTGSSQQSQQRIFSTEPTGGHTDKSGVQAADKALGTDTRIFEFTRYDDETHLRLLQETEYYHVDGIITVGEPHLTEMNVWISDCVKRGIPVVLLDTDSPESNRNCYIGTDNVLAGEIAAEKILETAGPEAQAVVFVAGIDEANQRERLHGFRNTFDRSENATILEVVEKPVDKLQFQEILHALFLRYPQMNAAFCAEASTSSQVSIYLNNFLQDRAITVIGFDEVPPVPEMVKEGILEGIVLQKGYTMGYQAVEWLAAHPAAEGAQSAPSSSMEIYTDVIYVDQSNIDSYLS